MDMCPSTSANHKATTLAVESFGRLGKDASENILSINQLTTSVVGERDGAAMAKRGICKEHLLQIASVISEVAISHRVHRRKLLLRDRQEMRGRKEGRGGRADADGVGLAHRCRVREI